MKRSLHLVLFIVPAMRAFGLYHIRSEDWRRQVPQPTLPSNYWWPYASSTWQGSGTSATVATVPAITVTPSIVSPTTAASVSSTVPSDSTSLTMAPSTSTSNTLSSSITSSSVSSVSTDPQQTSITHTHASRLSIPLIASIAGGTVVLFVLILLLCRCWARRRRREYTTRRTSRRRRDRGEAEKGWQRVSRTYQPNRQHQQSWWNKVFSTRGEEVEEVVPGPRYVGVEMGRDVEIDGAREAAFEQRQRSIPAPKDLLSVQPLIPSRSTSTTTALLAELYDDENDEYDESKDHNLQVPWESLRHKSIKRAILAKVDEEKKWTDSIRGIRAAKAKADAGVGRRQTHARCDSDFWVPAKEKDGGFRIVAESPPEVPSPPWLSSFPFFSRTASDEDVVEVDDRYTPAPTRMKTGSRRGSITSPRRAITRAQDSAVDVARVLMRSPRTVTSPEMESALCFTPLFKSHWGFLDGSSGDTFLGQERIQGRQDAGPIVSPGAFTKTYKLRTDRALRRVEAIVESGWTERRAI